MSESKQAVRPLRSVFHRKTFAGKVALVTGGGTGIGFRIARELLYLGCRVAICSRKLAQCQKAAAVLAKECRTAFKQGSSSNEVSTPRVLAVQCNIRKPESVDACLSTVIAAFGAKDSSDGSSSNTGVIDILINNAGGQFPSPALGISRKGFHAVTDTNLTGTFVVSKKVCERCFAVAGADGRDYRGGTIVNIIADTLNGFPMMSHTGAARAGVDNLTKSLSMEWAQYGVRVNAVAPGVIASSGLEKYPPGFKETLGVAASFSYAYRLGTEEEVSSCVCFLASAAASYVTGCTIRVDGGSGTYRPMWPPSEHILVTPYMDELPTDATEAHKVIAHYCPLAKPEQLRQMRRDIDTDCKLRSRL